jgi:hypothetical protein
MAQFFLSRYGNLRAEMLTFLPHRYGSSPSSAVPPQSRYDIAAVLPQQFLLRAGMAQFFLSRYGRNSSSADMAAVLPQQIRYSSSSSSQQIWKPPSRDRNLRAEMAAAPQSRYSSSAAFLIAEMLTVLPQQFFLSRYGSNSPSKQIWKPQSRDGNLRGDIAL